MQQLPHRKFSALDHQLKPVSLLKKATKRRWTVSVLLKAMLALVMVASACLWAGYAAANVSHAAKKSSRISAQYEGPVRSKYGLSDTYWELSVNYSLPAVPLLSRTRFLSSNTSCWDLAKGHPEPYTEDYRTTDRTPTVNTVTYSLLHRSELGSVRGIHCPCPPVSYRF